MSLWVALKMLHLYILFLRNLFGIEFFWKCVTKKVRFHPIQGPESWAVQCQHFDCFPVEVTHGVEYPPSAAQFNVTQIHDDELQVLEQQDWHSHFRSDQSFHLLMLLVFAQLQSSDVQMPAHLCVSFSSPPSDWSLDPRQSLCDTDRLLSCPPLASLGTGSSWM